MPNKSQSYSTCQTPPGPLSPDSRTWTPREAYLLALVCLLSGLLLGYLFHGSSPAIAPTAVSAPAASPSAPLASAAMPSAKDLEPLAAPLLAALRVDPKNYENLAQLGNLYYDHQAYPEAIEYYTRAVALRPQNVNVRTDLGTAYWYSGFPEKAIAEYERSLALDPAHANTLFNLGIVKLEGMQDSGGAIAAWEKLLRLNPPEPQRTRALELVARAREMRKR